MNDIIKIIKSLENSGALINGVTKTEKQVVKNQEGRFLGALLEPLVALLVQLLFSSVVKSISRRGVIGAGNYVKNVQIRSYSSQLFPVLGLNTERYSISLRI